MEVQLKDIFEYANAILLDVYETLKKIQIFMIFQQHPSSSRLCNNKVYVTSCSIAGLFRFLLSFVLIPSSDPRERLIRILEGLGGQAGCHMYWALGS